MEEEGLELIQEFKKRTNSEKLKKKITKTAPYKMRMQKLIFKKHTNTERPIHWAARRFFPKTKREINEVKTTTEPRNIWNVDA